MLRTRGGLNLNRKGLTGALITVLLMILVLVFIIILYAFVSFTGPVLTYTTTLATDTLASVDAPGTALTNATETVFVPVNEGLGNLEWLSYFLLIIMVIGFMMLCFFVRTYPFLIIFWLLFVTVIVFSTIYISSAYEDLSSSNDDIGNAYRNWETNNFLLAYLPGITSAIGFLGGIVLFILASRGGGDTEI